MKGKPFLISKDSYASESGSLIGTSFVDGDDVTPILVFTWKGTDLDLWSGTTIPISSPVTASTVYRIHTCASTRLIPSGCRRGGGRILLWQRQKSFPRKR